MSLKIKNNKKVLILIILFLVLFVVSIIIYIVNNKNSTSDIKFNSDPKSAATYYVNKKSVDDSNKSNNHEDYLIEGEFLSDGIVTDEEKEAMQHNTMALQKLIDDADFNQNIQIPSGVYYFYKGGTAKTKCEDYVIRPKSGVIITGSGTDDSNYTILKPYAEEGTIKYGLDMFYFNDYSDSNKTNAAYLENVSFNDFIIDGENVRGNVYNSSGKGFMINLCRNCFWNNIIVKNTDGTGFGMDNVINGKITNSMAINCGKNANESDEGASGFGIGTGFSNEESMYIENCKSIGNTKFGFFFEHQGRFTKHYEASSSKGFVVINSEASGNLYNFGGLRANDVSYINCKVSNNDTLDINNNYTKLDIYFDDESRRTKIQNFTSEYIFSDVDKNSIYYDAIKWGYNSGITYGVSKNEFGIGKFATRAEAIVLLWRYAGRPGDVLVGSLLDDNNRKMTNIETGFIDVLNYAWYTSAIKWGVDNKIINGISKAEFSPDSYVTTAQFLTMLYRYRGEPKVNVNHDLTNVQSSSFYFNASNWAYDNGIIIDRDFNPDSNCTREQIVQMLYRYATN